MPSEILRLSFSDVAELEREIANNLRYGRLFVADVLDAPVLSEGVVVIVHPADGRELRLAAQIVMINGDGPMKGTGLALRGFGPSEVEQLVAFARQPAEAQALSEDVRAGPGELTEPTGPVALNAPLSRASFAPPASSRSSSPPRGEAEQVSAEADGASRDPSVLLGYAMPDHSASEDEVPSGPSTEPSPPLAAEDDWSDVMPDEQQADASDGFDPAADLAEHADAETDDAQLDSAQLDGAQFDDADLDDAELDDAAAEQAAEPPATDLQRDNRLERLRTLNATQQLKVARRGELQDRVVVERLYGKQVWAALLENPRITLPEVARIARKGTVPRPLIESIVDNNAWIRADNVRRALLSNPKLTPEGIAKLMRITPRHELKVMEKTTAYPMSVRDAARKLLRDS